MKPFLSVVIPTYNGEKFIAATFESVLQQHIHGIELIVVDDGSTDRTLEIIRDYAKKLPIRLITPKRTGNWVANSNLGLREASGDWACFLQQDDYWLPGRINRIRTELDGAEGALVLHNAIFVGPNGQNLGPWTCPLSDGQVQPEYFIERLLVQNFIAVLSPIFRRALALEGGGMDEALWVDADWDLWLRLGALGPVRFINKTFSAFRIHQESQVIVHRRRTQEWGQQLAITFERHFSAWPGSGRHRESVRRAAMTSIAINSALYEAAHGQRNYLSSALVKLLLLGPAGWRRYFRDSRIMERTGSRLKLRRLEKAGESSSTALNPPVNIS